MTFFTQLPSELENHINRIAAAQQLADTIACFQMNINEILDEIFYDSLIRFSCIPKVLCRKMELLKIMSTCLLTDKQYTSNRDLTIGYRVYLKYWMDLHIPIERLRNTFAKLDLFEEVE